MGLMGKYLPKDGYNRAFYYFISLLEDSCVEYEMPEDGHDCGDFLAIVANAERELIEMGELESRENDVDTLKKRYIEDEDFVLDNDDVELVLRTIVYHAIVMKRKPRNP